MTAIADITRCTEAAMHGPATCFAASAARRLRPCTTSAPACHPLDMIALDARSDTLQLRYDVANPRQILGLE